MAEKISKHKQYGFVYGIRTKTPVGRLAWVNLVKPKESTFPVEEGKDAPPPRYEVTLLLPKTAEVDAWVAEVNEQTKEMVALFNKDRKGAKIAVDDMFLKDGDDVDTEKYPFYAGHYYMVPKMKDRPSIYDAQLNEITDPSVVVGGMKALLIVRPLCTAHGISFQLRTVQLLDDDGVRFGGSISEDKDLLSACGGEEETTAEVAPEVKEVPVEVVAKAVKGKKSTLNLDSLA